jgi:alpha-ribazole phosphatase
MPSNHGHSNPSPQNPQPDPSIRLLLVRHGQTDWNVRRRYQGQSDTSLNDTGKAQAAAVARRLAGEEIHAIYASDLQRAWQTAQVISGELGMTVQPEPGLREIHFGLWEGQTHEEILSQYAEEHATWVANSEYAPPGGESFGQVAERLDAVLAQIWRDHQNQTVLLVGHGGALTTMICRALELPVQMRWKMRLESTSVSELILYEGTTILMHFNDTHHLNGLSKSEEDV